MATAKEINSTFTTFDEQIRKDYKAEPERLPFLLEAIVENYTDDKAALLGTLIASVKWWLKIAEETK